MYISEIIIKHKSQSMASYIQVCSWGSDANTLEVELPLSFLYQTLSEA